jgi:hypothetical protein
MKYIQTAALIICSCFLFSTTAIGDSKTSVMFFSSNNTNEITIKTAYERLIGNEQKDLQNEIINLMQKNHLEQGKFEDILGTYQMSSSQNVTEDNTDVFNTSPYQKLSNEKVFTLAKQLAITLKQESVAVFIPNQKSTIGDITVSFASYQPSITKIINILNAKLPPAYSQAFSLHLSNENADFDNLKVAEVEWLGSKAKLEEIKKAFPQEKISYYYGTAYLVYKNGQKKQL